MLGSTSLNTLHCTPIGHLFNLVTEGHVLISTKQHNYASEVSRADMAKILDIIKGSVSNINN